MVKTLKTYLSRIARIVLFVTPLIIFGFALIGILIEIIFYRSNELSLDIVQALVIMSATLSMLSFGYASATKSALSKKHKIAIYCGERLLQATMFSIIGWVLFYFGEIISTSWNIKFSTGPINQGMYVLGQIVKWLGIPFIFMVTIDIDFAVKKLWTIANKDVGKYNTDDLSQNWNDF